VSLVGRLAWRAFVFLWRFRVWRWVMNGFLSQVIKSIPGVLAKLIVALAGPTIRSLALRGGDLKVLLGYVGQLYLTQVPAYVALGTYTAVEVQDIAEALRDTLAFALAGYSVTLTSAEVAAMATAVGDRLAVRYPNPAP